MKRYAVFAGERYYPSGGWNDFEGAFESLAEAEAEGEKHTDVLGWFHIVDMTDGTIVKEHKG